MSSFLQEKIDIAAHNAEVARVWNAYNSGKPYRVPLMIIGSITNYFLNPELNTNGWTFKDFFENPDVQIRAQLEYQKWQRFNILCDREMGVPNDGWQISVDFQNCYDASWFGCPIKYIPGQVPDTEDILKTDKMRLYDMPECIDYDNGLIGRAIEFFDYMHDQAKDMEFEGRAVISPDRILGEGTDGPLDLAYKLRGADNVLMDMMTDEKYYHDLMGYITDNLINRMKKLRQLRSSKLSDNESEEYGKGPFFFADDAVALISNEHYQEFVYPYHKRIVDEFSDNLSLSLHMCGDATRHFKFIKDSLGVTAFDTGFPVDHGWLREQLGPDITIQGGPTVMTIKYGNPKEIECEVKKVCQSGVMKGGKFIMIAANNLAPCTPVENVKALYESTKVYGNY